ncbi:hypothetical protein O6H91_Y303800 [Diphasiastrum complanatum]|nr:hypothetical protein O6H91_Y303800 [Diphasiastrum complanatum]
MQARSAAMRFYLALYNASTARIQGSDGAKQLEWRSQSLPTALNPYLQLCPLRIVLPRSISICFNCAPAPDSHASITQQHIYVLITNSHGKSTVVSRIPVDLGSITRANKPWSLPPFKS